MEEILPIVLDGRNVGTVIIKRSPKQATKAARAIASHISTPTDIQFCPFSDGSHGYDNRGGVGLVYRRQWLPQGWAPEHAVTNLKSDFVERAWPYGHAKDNMMMEVVGIVEALQAADESIKQHRSILKKHGSTVTVKATTDCQPVLHHIAKQTPSGGKVGKAMPHQIIKQIKDQMLAIQSHGIKVSVELHWCPRNMVQQMTIADNLAGEARKRGLGYCNVTQNLWTRATESTTMKELLLVLSGTIGFAQLPKKISHSSTTLEKEITVQNTTEARQESRRTRRTVNVSTESSKSAADLQHGDPVPDTILPPNPMTTSNTELSTIPSTKPTAAAPKDAQPSQYPAEVQTEKRKVEEVEVEEVEEDMEESEGRPTKKSKPSPDSPTQDQQAPLTMPAAWGMDPETKVYIADPATGLFTETAVARAEWIRTNLDSTLVTGETNVFISDGVSGFCVAKPMGITRQG